jgi:hypothetical protein
MVMEIEANTTTEIVRNAHKFTYLAKAYPEKSIKKIIELMQLPQIDVNCAIWLTLDAGWVRVVKHEETDYAETPKLPDAWDFGPEVDNLKTAIIYMFAKLNAEEKDLEEHYLANLLAGYPVRDTLVAIKHLLETGTIHEYQIEDGEDSYIFYTLKVNAGKNWGQKQFKTNPLTGEPKKNNY